MEAGHPQLCEKSFRVSQDLFAQHRTLTVYPNNEKRGTQCAPL